MHKTRSGPRSTGLTLAQDFAEEIRAQRQEGLFQLLLAFALAVTGTLALYLVFSVVYRTPPLHSFLGLVRDPELPWLAAVMLSRGPLQPINLCFFACGASVLALRLLTMRREFQAFYQPYMEGIPLNEESQLVLGEEVRTIPLENVRKIKEQYSSPPPLLVRRMEAGSRQLAEDGDAKQVHSVMHAMSEIDRDALESRFTLLRYLTWLIPTLGFLGTVIGMGLAITGFAGVMSRLGQTSSDFQAELQPILAEVAGDLGVAFDTTLLALFLTAILVALTSIAQMREEGLLSSIDEFGLRYFVSRIAVPDASAKQMGENLQGLLVPVMQTLMAQQRGGKDAASSGEESIALRDIAGAIAGQTQQLVEIKQTLLRAVEERGTRGP